jgi:hypothetical protein
MKTKLLIILSLTIALKVYADSATWNLNPISNDWNTAANWTPNTVPNGPTDVATFDVSNVTNVSISADTTVAGIVYNAGASAFTITAPPALNLTLAGTGITNNSGTTQNFVTAVDANGGGNILFTGSATAGEGTTFTNPGSFGSMEGCVESGHTEFHDNATAGGGIFIANPSALQGCFGGEINFFDNSTADDATFTANGANVFDAAGGLIQFFGTATAGNGSFTIKGGTNTGNYGQATFSDRASAGNATITASDLGTVTFLLGSTADHAMLIAKGAGATADNSGGFGFDDNATAADATIICDGATSEGFGGGVGFHGRATAGNATITLNSGLTSAGGGTCEFNESADGGTARVITFGNSRLLIFSGLTIGSIEGTGHVHIDDFAYPLVVVGSNNLSTHFSGLITFRSPFTKIGTGTLTLTGAGNRGFGRVSVDEGTLIVNNPAKSGLGHGKVRVNGGTLGGGGIIAGLVTVGNGSSAGAFLAPAAGTSRKATLTLLSNLRFEPDGIYTYTFKGRGAEVEADQVIANGVTINAATINLLGKTQGTLQIGLVLTLISNTSANPISGTFANLPDGAIVTVNGNNFQADYEGGDGNDLTLTVVP